MTARLLRRASTAPGTETDIAVRDGLLVPLDRAGFVEHVVDLEGRPTITGLADDHVHLMAQAAAWDSVDCSPSALAAGGGLASVLRDARLHRPGGWLRATGYDMTASGRLDRRSLDEAGAGPLRVQDRTGMFWVLDSAGLAAVLPTAREEWPPGLAVDAAGRPTGVLYRLDPWLRGRVTAGPLDLAAVGRALAELGVVALTDATATNGTAELEILAAAGLPQKLTAMTSSAEVPPVDGVRQGPVKIVLDEAQLPSAEGLIERIAGAHARGRSVAVHCVDSASVVLAVSSGLGPGDRVEHASLVDEQVVDLLARSGVRVVVQPGLVLTRGDRYLEETDPAQVCDLHRLASFLGAGIEVRLSSDAPYGPLDPWVTVAAAVRRHTASGRSFNAGEAVGVATALGLFTSEPPGVPLRFRLQPGSPADLVVLDGDWHSLPERPAVALTMIDGVPVHSRIGELAGPA